MIYLPLLLLPLNVLADPVVGTFVATLISGSAVIAGSVFITAAVYAVATYALIQISKPDARNATVEDQSRTQIIRSSSHERILTYGETKVNGLLAFIEVDDDDYLHMVLVWAHQQSEEILGLFINDEYVPTPDGSPEVTTGKYADHIEMYHHLGDQTIADAVLVGRIDSWTEEHKLLGQTYTYVRVEQNIELFPYGIPNIACHLKGKLVRDPRNNNNLVFSSNPILIAADFIQSPFGLGTDNIRDFTFAANICDEGINIPDEHGVGLDENRYAMSANVGLNESKLAVLDKIRQACDGNFYYSGGEWVLDIGRVKTPENRAITDEDAIKPISHSTHIENKEIFNVITPKFIDKGQDWRVTTTSNVAYPNRLEEDGREIVRIIDYNYVRTATRAIALASISLLKHRNRRALSIVGNLSLLQYELGDVVRVDFRNLNLEGILFDIEGIRLNNLEVTLLLREYTASVYADSSNVEIDYLPPQIYDHTVEFNDVGEHTFIAPSNALNREFRVYMASGEGGAVQVGYSTDDPFFGGDGGFSTKPNEGCNTPAGIQRGGGHGYTSQILRFFGHTTIIIGGTGRARTLMCDDYILENNAVGVVGEATTIRNAHISGFGTLIYNLEGGFGAQGNYVTPYTCLGEYGAQQCFEKHEGHTGADALERVGTDRGASRVIISWNDE